MRKETHPLRRLAGRIIRFCPRLCLCPRLYLCLLLSACSADYPPAPLPAAAAAAPATGLFTLPDGARLPYRAWLPPASPDTILLALHGFNDSYDAWELPAPVLAAAGIGVIAPDQPGFGGTADRGRWPGAAALITAAEALAAQLHQRYPAARLFLMGESMGGAVLMALAARPQPAWIAGYVLISPAVWGWSQMNILLRASLWLTNGLAPGLLLGQGPVRVLATDNRAALIRLSQDPRTLLRSRVAAVKGLVDLMEQAQRAAPALRRPALILYGGNDQLVPAHATRAAWRRLNHAPIRLAYYPTGYHLLLRDHARAVRIADIVAWLRHPADPLPSGADVAAQSWDKRGDQSRDQSWLRNPSPATSGSPYFRVANTAADAALSGLDADGSRAGASVGDRPSPNAASIVRTQAVAVSSASR